MTPQKKIRVGAGFAAVWVLLGGAWLCDYLFGDTELSQLVFGELTVVLGIGAGTAMIREGRRGQGIAQAADKKPVANEARNETGSVVGNKTGNEAGN